MRMSDDVELFIKGCYPKGVPLYRKAELRKELLSHIFDKADSLIKTGMSETESIAEAVKEMGDPSKIRQSFGKVYRFERLPGIIAFVVLTFVCIGFFSRISFIRCSLNGRFSHCVSLFRQCFIYRQYYIHLYLLLP